MTRLVGLLIALSCAVGCKSTGPDPEAARRSYCTRVRGFFTWLDSPLVVLDDALPRGDARAACDRAEYELIGTLHGFGEGVDPSEPAAQGLTDVLHDLSGELVHTLGAGCTGTSGGPVAAARAAITRARAKISICPVSE
jgi:hypothetical protein